MHVHVEVCVDFRCAEDDDVKAVHNGALCIGRGIMRRGNFLVTRVVADGFHSLQIEALYIHQRFKAALIQHIHKVACDAAKAKAAMDVFFQHHILQELCGGKGGAARTGLE